MTTSFKFYSIKNVANLFRTGILSLISFSAFTQDINNETNLFIPSGTEMRTEGSLTNKGFFQNNGSFALKGNWMNTATYQGTGRVILEGLDQTIANNNQSIEQLTIEGGGTKTIAKKIFVNNQLDFNNGIVLVNDADTLLMGIDCEIKGGSTSSYVEGALISQGSGYKFFPVGKNGNYHPLELLGVKGIRPVLEIEVFENLPDIQTAHRVNIKHDIYWTRKTIAGTFESSPITVGYDVRDPINVSRLVIAEGKNLEDEFSISDNVTFQTGDEFDIIGSRKALTGNIFAVGEFIKDPPKEYYFSTTLSPNASNPDNRTVKLFGDNLSAEDFYFQVFNRWGLTVFETKSFNAMMNDGWNGKQNGDLLPSGVYPFSLKYVDVSSGSLVQQTGFITIVQ